MTIKVFVAMSTTNSYMVHKNYMCIYIHTLYTHAHTFTHISLQKEIKSKYGKMLTIDKSR